tara:strand:+ start:314 stop:544 length:231 start_codon:yes stop_codon:yes gene_type:complete
LVVVVIVVRVIIISWCKWHLDSPDVKLKFKLKYRKKYDNINRRRVKMYKKERRKGCLYNFRGCERYWGIYIFYSSN